MTNNQSNYEANHEASKDEQSPLTRRAFLKSALVLTGAAATGLTLTRCVLPGFAQAADLTKKPTLYLIATAHDDTQWNWTVQNTINDFIPATMKPNWALFEKYPAYNFNYEGVVHYKFFKEYSPELWPEMQEWVRKGRWKLAGGWVNAVDVVVPSAESLFRQALYGQQFFRQEFGQVPRDIYLPDCFGFPYSLPSIARHSGMIAFSSQKLSWGGWIPAPFAVGRWEGVDGSEVVASLRCGAYNARIETNPARDPKWNGDLADAGDTKVNLRYFGTGDMGGTPTPESVAWAQKAMEDTDAPVRVVNTSSDQLAKDLTPAEIAALPHYKGELVMKTHGVGCYTSQAAMKRWNRMNEQLGDAAERASVAADWLGGVSYPHAALTDSWNRFLWHQFHDDLTGTCIPQAYTFSWNDELISLNQFSQVLTAGVGAVAVGLDTRVQGVPLVVSNALDQPRKDVVEATVALPRFSAFVRVFDAEGREVPSQILSRVGRSVRVLFQASVPSVGFSVYDVRLSPTPCELSTGLSVTASALENSRYKVGINSDGDIESVYDKAAKTELLQAPARLEAFHDVSHAWPAWEVLWEVTSKPPQGYVQDSPHVKILESGPARVALEITRTLGDSTFVQHVRLTPDGDWVEVFNTVDWKTPKTLIKAAFPMTASNPNAVFDIGLGTIERPNAKENLYEVNAQQWAGITDKSGRHGLAIFTDYKYGWDKPTDNTLRLTLIRTPDSGGSWHHQETNDIGSHHHFTYALAGHAGDWKQGGVPQRAARLNQPLRAFQTAAHDGSGGRSLSLLRVSTPQVSVRALKKAEDTAEYIVRVQEMHGEPAHNVALAFAAPVTAVRELNAIEEHMEDAGSAGAAKIQNGTLLLDMEPYRPRTFAVKLAPAPRPAAAPVSRPLTLPFNLRGISENPHRSDGDFDGDGTTYPGEMLPARLDVDGIEFHLGSSAAGAKNVLACRGQTLPLPPGQHNRLFLLASALGGDRSGVFTVHLQDDRSIKTTLRVQDWAQHIGQWDSRLAHPTRGDGGGQLVAEVRDGKVVNLDKLKPAYVKRDPIAWVGTHRHTPEGDEAYLFCYLFAYPIDLPAGAVSVTLPEDVNLRIMAMTAAQTALTATYPAGVLYEPGLTAATLPKPRARHQLAPGSVAYQIARPDNGLIDEAPDLPTGPRQPWTLNLFVYTDTAPEELTLLAGFGDGTDMHGTQRYLGRVHGGIQFWGSAIDIDTKQEFDLSRWQMLTATFDGAAVRLYKNGEEIGSGAARFAEAEPIVKVAPLGPWGDSRRFAGKIQNVAVWNSALDPAAVRALLSQMPKATDAEVGR